MKRLGSTRWNGGLREGKGAVSTESRASLASIIFTLSALSANQTGAVTLDRTDV